MSMKRGNSRAPSPTPTSFSGISNYRSNDPYPSRPRDKNAPNVPPIDYRQISKTHYEQLSKYLKDYLARSQAGSRTNARQKLTRLTIQQFHELSTDVYDELLRRTKETNEVPFLPVRQDFHPKRNQARQKLATLPTTRFEDLSSDVYFELARRYPEFSEDPSGKASDSNYDDYPAPDFPSSSNTPSRTSTDRPSDSGYSSGRRPEDRRRPSEVDYPPPRRSEENYRRPDEGQYPGPRIGDDSFSASLASRRKPSQDVSRRQDDREGPFARRPSASVSNTSDGTATGNPPSQSTTATSGMIIPIKSTMEEEYIEVPYGREQRESGGTLDTPGGDGPRDIALAEDSASEYPASPMTPRSPPAGGLSGLGARLKMEDDDDDMANGANKSGDDLYDKYGRSSVNSDRSASGGRFNGRASVTEETEKMRRDYEYKVATMQTQITALQREVANGRDKDQQWKNAEARANELDDELEIVRAKVEEQANSIIELQRELGDLRETRQREKEREARRIQDDEEELQILRDRCERLEAERGQSGENDQDVEQLRHDAEGLLSELESLSRRNEELMTSKDSDLTLIRDLDVQLKEYKRKYEQAKNELRSLKATSQLFLPAPKFERSEDQLPVDPDGGVLDVHVTAFISAIDSLLTAGRSNAPTRVLVPMKTVVNAVTNIVEDVRAFERRPRGEVDLDNLRSLRERAEATLENLVVATKTHATSHGMSPVSLLDAASSHLSKTVTEIVNSVFLRRATKADLDQFPYSTPPPSAASNGYASNLRTVGESASGFAFGHQRKGSQASSISSLRNQLESPSSPPNRSYADSRRRPSSANSRDAKSPPPPPPFDRQTAARGRTSEEAAPAAETEDAWAELKPYLEAQTESIVYAIQGVLSAVRSPTPPATLNENLTQIITIVSSIVAVCNDNLPFASAQQGAVILRGLGEHADKLSEAQALPEVTKESRQVMAKSSFAIANAMKELMKL